MKKSLSSVRHLANLALAVSLFAATPADAAPDVPVPPAIAAMARAIAAELLMHCPVADADDLAALQACRAGIEGQAVLRSHLPAVVLWGHHGAQPAGQLPRVRMTQLAPDTWAQLYAPLFMFNGNHEVEWMPQENLFVIRLEAAFRNRLPAGQFPSPFWHDADQWAAYQNTNGLLLWVQPQTRRIHVAQFTDRAATPLLQAVTPVARAFDGKWLWTDAAGRAQPAVAQLEGLYAAENPHLRSLDKAYRDLNLQMREARCGQCHVPSNPAGAHRLVLLSSPAHTAGEIDRVIQAVRQGSMPPQGHALTAEDREWLLRSAQVFRDTLRAARAWARETGGFEPLPPSAALEP